MDLTFRPAEIRDVEACIAMLPPEAEADPSLSDVWRRWLQSDLMQIVVIEDAGGLIAFGAGVFVTDAFCQEVQTTLPPGIGGQAVRRWRAGDPLLLNMEAVRRANSGNGLNLLILNIGWREQGLTMEEVRLIKLTLVESLFFFYRGYRLKVLLQEIFSEEEKERGLAIGALVKNDYEGFYAAHAEALPPPNRRPYLIGARRDEVKEGAYLSSLFFYAPPCFFFTLGEQAVLRLALLDRTDDEIACALNVSPATVHKRWRAIFERVAASQPALFPSPSAAALEQKRGMEKRRRLLGYLRHHPEELRPVLPQC